jgi:hypothetical protein
MWLTPSETIRQYFAASTDGLSNSLLGPAPRIRFGGFFGLVTLDSPKPPKRDGMRSFGASSEPTGSRTTAREQRSEKQARKGRPVAGLALPNLDRTTDRPFWGFRKKKSQIVTLALFPARCCRG